MSKINPLFTISVEENSNKIIGSSEEKFIGIRPGSLIKVNNEQTLYTILNKESSFYIKSFNLLDPKTLIIDDNIGVNLQIGDNIQISYKEYEAILVLDILSGGQGYNKDSELKIRGGDLSIDISNGIGDNSILKATEVDGLGAIKQVGIKNKGRYLTPPKNPVEVYSDNGLGATFELKYNECNNRNILERNIVNINFKENETLITVNYSLPLNLKQGKLSVEKNYLILESQYLGKTQSNTSYQIFRDFTPNFNLSLMSNNSLSPAPIYNRSMQILDSKIQELEDKIKVLENKK